MTKRLLITAGCSFTEDSYYHQFGIMSWPRIMSDSLGIELVNLGRGGNSNDAIENQVTDAVIKYADRDPIVMVLWTEPIRINVFDGKTMFLIGDMAEEKEYPGSDLWPKVDPIDFSYYVMKHSLRTMWRTKKFVEDMGFAYFDKIGLHSVSEVLSVPVPDLVDTTASKLYRHNKLMERLTENWYFKQLNITRKDLEHGMELEISDDSRLECGHPDQAGHELIAQNFMDKYFKSLEPRHKFIYE